MIRHSRFVMPLVAVWLAACAHQPAVVVLPAADGHIGGVVMTAGSKSVVLDSAYASAAPGDTKPGQSNAVDVNKTFADVLAARPTPPKTYDPLLFENDSDTKLLPESADYLKTILAEITARRARGEAVEIVITGHTDTVGALDYNDRLSLQRASAVADQIAALGVDRNYITAVGRGEREDRDPDNTANPKERRVDITAR